MAVCGFCSGSGKDPVKHHMRCVVCGGMGVVPDSPKKQGPASSSGGSGAVAGLLALVLSGAGYFFCAAIFFRYWVGESQQNWVHFAIYTAAAVTFVFLAARHFGAILGFLSSLPFLVPLFFATRGGIGLIWIVFRLDSEPGTSKGVAWAMIVAALIANALLAREAARSGRQLRAVRGHLWAASSVAGRIALVASLLLYVAAAVATYVAAQYFGR